MILSYNSDKCVTCHNSGLGKYFQVFFRLLLHSVYIDGNVLVASLVEKTRLLLQEEKRCRRYNGPGYDKRYIMVILIKNLDYVASAKYDNLRAFPENLKHLLLILTNIWRFKATDVIRFKTCRQKER